MIEPPSVIYNLKIPRHDYINGRQAEKWIMIRSSENYRTLQNFAQRTRLTLSKINKKVEE